MTKLDCSVTGCTYNADNSCRRTDIAVGGHEANKPSETACKSFAPKGTNRTRNAVESKPSKDTEVACDAVRCRYNTDKKCSATHIGIAGVHAVTNGETECGSFQCK